MNDTAHIRRQRRLHIPHVLYTLAMRHTSTARTILSIVLHFLSFFPSSFLLQFWYGDATMSYTWYLLLLLILLLTTSEDDETDGNARQRRTNRIRACESETQSGRESERKRTTQYMQTAKYSVLIRENCSKLECMDWLNGSSRLASFHCRAVRLLSVAHEHKFSSVVGSKIQSNFVHTELSVYVGTGRTAHTNQIISISFDWVLLRFLCAAIQVALGWKFGRDVDVT